MASPAGLLPSHPRPAPRRRTRKSKLTLPRRRPLREALLGAFARIVGSARRQARGAEADPAPAVHEYRKAIRRARAVVELLRPPLGREAARGIAGELRRAFAETGARRDADILLATLSGIASEDPARAAIEETLAAELKAASNPFETARTLDRGARILQPLPAALGVVLPRSLSVDDVERGLARSLRRVQRSLHAAVASGVEADFHRWRKRVKELRYQIELLASTGSAELKAREKKLAALAEELGRTTDLIVLIRELERRRSGGTLPEAPELSGAIRESIRDRIRELISRGQEQFTETPGEFARQVLAERG